VLVVLPRALAPAVRYGMVPRPDLSLVLQLVAPRARFHVVSLGLADCMVSTAAVRSLFVVSRVAPRSTGPTATGAIATAMATGSGLMLRRPRLTPMAHPTAPAVTAITDTHTNDTTTGAFSSVMETD
jgi:hypothetical protein